MKLVVLFIRYFISISISIFIFIFILILVLGSYSILVKHFWKLSSLSDEYRILINAGLKIRANFSSINQNWLKKNIYFFTINIKYFLNY
jgi:biopolymer transport protein ExbB/TolQ